ncbi:MopE-related protein [Desulfosarcina ovata]|uniref:MopE-related protein n=1 Tax=Desulfosarcina ovata TaxID=83564 RepID=UPI0015630A9B|nr:MopE-related protein [Desulfosarcina ovata]
MTQIDSDEDGYSYDVDCDDADATVNPGATEEPYNGKDDDCNAATLDDDLDQDGYVLADDCDDTDASVNPGATEVCDGIDNNCDGQIDEGVTITFYLDADGDGFGDEAASTEACEAPTGYVAVAGDCDDADAAINPGATEVCDDIDNNCDGQIDEGCGVYYQDADGDGYGNPDVSIEDTELPSGYVTNNTDCDDTDASVNPGATEVPYNGKDDDCNPDTLDDDLDQDGYVLADDCDDTDAAVNPEATEVCDGIDNNCDGQIDEGVTTTFYLDADGDGFGDEAAPTEACEAPTGYVAVAGDCDDTDAAINPGATEVCDDIDNNCDGQIDEGCGVYYQDADGDGYGNPDVSIEDTALPSGYVTNNTDCDDNDATVNPGATEVPYNGKDDDCNPDTLDDDFDQDGYVLADDCDDTDASVNPGAAEVCDGIDNNCDGQIDEGVTTTFYLDADGDGFGDEAAPTEACETPTGYVAVAGDCDDTNATVNPGATEVPYNGKDDDCNPDTLDDDLDQDGYVLADDCDDTDASVNPGAAEVCDGIDNNCDGQIDEGVTTTFYLDADGDGFGDEAAPTEACETPTGYVAVAGDCDDTNATVYPNAPELNDDIDNDCDGEIDEGWATYYQDADNDGFGNASVSTEATEQPTGYVSDNTDCDDSDNTVHPGATELADGKDNDCDGEVDEGISTYYRDADGDGYGTDTDTVNALEAPDGYVAVAGDCDDTDASVNPGATEVPYNGKDDDCNPDTLDDDLDQDGYVLADDCDDTDAAVNPEATEVCDGIDNNCDGQIDEGCGVYYQDADGDGYGNPDVSIDSTKQPDGYVENNTDCNDTDPDINPGAEEIPNNDVDENCDGIAFMDIDLDGVSDELDQCPDTPSGVSVDTNGCAATQIDADEDGYSSDVDCNDNDPDINPGATEIPNNDVDENCDGIAFMDADLDGVSDELDQCPDTPSGVSVDANGCAATQIDADEDGYSSDVDCNDNDPDINPGVEEIPNNDVDENCDGIAENEPDAIDDTYNVDEDTALVVTSTEGVLENDTDADGDALTAILVDVPQHGTLIPDTGGYVLNPDGSFTYEPNENFYGEDSFTYYVNDGVYDSTVALVTLTVNPVNDAPVANAGPDQSNASIGDPVELDGSGSSDIDGTEMHYLWTIISRPDGSTAVIDNSDTVQPSFTPDVYGTYEIELTVDDGSGEDNATDTDTVVITTIDNDPPLAHIEGPSEGIVGEEICVNDNESLDPNGDSITFNWSLSAPSGSSLDALTSAASSLCFTPDITGSYEVSLIVNDGLLDSEPATLAIAVETSNEIPVASIVYVPSNPVTGEEVCLDGSGSYDPDESPEPLTYDWTLLSKPEDSLAELDASIAPCFSGDVAGDYHVQLIVNDGAANSEPATEVITVEENLVAVPEASSCDDITAVGLECNLVEECNDDVPEGEVIGQDPLPGTEVAAGSIVTLTVSTGPCGSCDVPGDLDGDCDVDLDDRSIFLSSYRKCSGVDGYNSDADYDEDGCISLNDYRQWYKYYVAFNN